MNNDGVHRNLLCNYDFSGQKEKPNSQDYDRFVSNCISEIKSLKTTICFNKEQVEDLKRYFGDLEIVKVDYYWVVNKNANNL